MGATFTCCICSRKSHNPHTRLHQPHTTPGHPSLNTQPRDLRHLLPSPVQNLRAEVDGRHPSITLKWSHPTSNWSQVIGYEVQYSKLLKDGSSSMLQTHPNSCEMIKLTPDNGIEPLRMYSFSVRPTSNLEGLHTQWKTIDVFIRWYCQFPGCTTNRRRRCNDDSISDFCSSNHAREFSRNYCLLPGCCNQRHGDYFCSRTHLEEATRKGFSALVSLDQSCKEYSDLQKEFSKTWCKKKGQQPKIYFILKIINPSMEQTLHEYSSSMPRLYRKIKRYYHGTNITCDLSEYLQPCSDTRCAVCSIAKKGFDPDRINSNSWQRFGRGFYFAPNSSKSYDYPLAGQVESTPLTLPCRALLVCEVVPGRKYILHKNEPDLQGPPPDFHSVYGDAKWLFFRTSPDLNYDELVIFNKEAIKPSFILLCESLRN